MGCSFAKEIKRKIQAIAYRLTSPECVSKIYFKAKLGYSLNLEKPTTLNEKLQWLKLYYWPNDAKAVQCADKYEVRSYIESVGKKDILNDIFSVYDTPDEIDWAALPDKFVLKCNHGCGYNVICKDKANLDLSKTKKLLSKWLKEDYSEFKAEPHYSKIPPKILCEKFLEGEIVNYNIYVFNGKAQFLSVAGGLGEGINEYLAYYNIDGTVADFQNRSFAPTITTLSPLLPEMIETAEYLAKGFPLVRVDLYDVKGKIVFSEMTFTPGSAIIPFDPVEADRTLGNKLDISALLKKRLNPTL